MNCLVLYLIEVQINCIVETVIHCNIHDHCLGHMYYKNSLLAEIMVFLSSFVVFIFYPNLGFATQF